MQRAEGNAVMTKPSSKTARRRLGVSTWLAAGAVTLGLGVALVDGAAVASADTGSASSSSSAGPAQKHSASSARKTQAKPTSSVKAARSDVARSTDAVAPPAARASKTPSAAATPIESLARQLQYIFFNKAPTVVVNPVVRNQDGSSAGTLTGQSNNGFALTYSLGRKAEFGDVDVDPVTGAFTYTPNGTAPSSDLVDGFSIIANNGTAARLPGVLGVAQALLHALAISLGVSSKNTDESDIVVSLTDQTVIGNPGAKVNYWLTGNGSTSTLTAVGMVLGQLTGNMPSMDALITEAENTLSVRKFKTVKQTGQSTNVPLPMYSGGKDEVWWADGNQLLSIHGATVTGSYYSKDGGLLAAEENLSAALRAGYSVIVYRKSSITYTGYSRVYDHQHAVTVLGFDIANQAMYINDGAQPEGGQNLRLSYADFVAQWGTIYETVVVSLPPTNTASL